MNDLYIHQLETENKQLRTELHIERARILQALEEFKYFFPILTTPIGEVVHLQDKMKHVEKAIKILGGKENTITLNTKDMNITGGKYERQD